MKTKRNLWESRAEVYEESQQSLLVLLFFVSFHLVSSHFVLSRLVSSHYIAASSQIMMIMMKPRRVIERKRQLKKPPIWICANYNNHHRFLILSQIWMLARLLTLLLTCLLLLNQSSVTWPRTSCLRARHLSWLSPASSGCLMFVVVQVAVVQVWTFNMRSSESKMRFLARSKALQEHLHWSICPLFCSLSAGYPTTAFRDPTCRFDCFFNGTLIEFESTPIG